MFIHLSKNHKHTITAAPNKYAANLIHLPPGIENSSTITSEHEMYKKVPPARLVNTTSTIAGAFPSKIPKVTPRGVANENMKISQKMILKLFGNDLPIDIDKDIPSAHLCNKIAIIKSTALDKFGSRPKANPSKTE